MKLHVKSLPIKEVLDDLAESMGGKVSMDANYYELSLPPSLGEGVISGIDFGRGFGMINYQCTFNVDTEISFDLSSVHPLKFIYVSEGRLAHRFEVEQNRRAVDTYQNLVVASKANNGHILYFYAGERVTMCSIEIDRVKFCTRFVGKFGDEEMVFRNLLLDTTALTQFCYEGEYALAISKHINEVLAPGHGGVMQSMFLEGKAYNILVLQWQQYQEDNNREKDRQLLRTSSLIRIQETIKYVESNLSAKLDITSLSEWAKLNSAELQQGFQYFTTKSVSQHVRECRLLKAMQLLRSGEFNVSETCYAVGFSSLSYFSRKFKERWGFSPSTLNRGIDSGVLDNEEE